MGFVSFSLAVLQFDFNFDHSAVVVQLTGLRVIIEWLDGESGRVVLLFCSGFLLFPFAGI